MAGKKNPNPRGPRGSIGKGAEGSALQADRIVEDIALEIAEGKWRPHKSVRELAARLDISLVMAQRYAAQATRLLRMSWGGEEAKVAVLERIAQIGREAEARTEDVLDMSGNVHTLRKPDMKSALASAIKVGEALGLFGTNAEVVVHYQQMSDVDLLREVARLQQENSNATSAIESTGLEVDPASDAHALDRANAQDAGRGWRGGL